MRISLECEHELWLTVPPLQGDVLWCVRCETYRNPGPRHLDHGVIHPDYAWEGFKKKRGSRICYGRCLICGDVIQRTAYYLLEQAMEAHHIKEHTNSSLKHGLTLTTARKLPRNTPPPF